jgi:hypothetical protein
MDKVIRLEKYINDFFVTRWDNYQMFYRDVSENRRHGIYNLKKGNELMDMLNNIHGNLEERLYSEKLVPQIFATPDKLIGFLKAFKEHLQEYQPLLDLNTNGEQTSYIIQELQSMKIELVELMDYLIILYDNEDILIPYQELRHSLITKDVAIFFKNMNSILASVSYPILKTKEGYLHSNIHLILKLLGFDIISEESTNIGRIDAVIRFSETIYIFEFKLGTSLEAIAQIKENKYYEKFIIEKKEIFLVGVGFDSGNRNISDFKFEVVK